MFKIIHHPQKGALSFLRVYRGSVKEGDSLYNLSKGTSEKVTSLMVAFADDFKPVKEVTSGNIAIVAGMRETGTGDTLLSGLSVAKSALAMYKAENTSSKSDDQDVIPADPERQDLVVSPYLSGVSVPDPVFYASIEPPSMAYAKKLDLALSNLAREDPSLGVSVNEDTGQTVLSGMGELHLEIVLDRIRKEYKVDADLGDLMIAYRSVTAYPFPQRSKYHFVTNGFSYNK